MRKPQVMPGHLTKVSFILPKADKPLLERAARKAESSMSAVISEALIAAGVLRRRARKVA